MGMVSFTATPLDEARTEIVAGLGRRDPDVVEGLVGRYGHRLYRYLVHLTGDPAMADDLFQETWLRVLDRGWRYDGRAPFFPWLLVVARNLTLDCFRRRSPVSLADLTRDGACPLSDGRPSPLDAVLAHRDRERLTALLARLPASQREVLLLRFQEDLSLAEIAGITGVPLPTVKSRLYRGLRALESLWGEGRT